MNFDSVTILHRMKGKPDKLVRKVSNRKERDLKILNDTSSTKIISGMSSGQHKGFAVVS